MGYLMKGFLMNVMAFAEYNKLDFKQLESELKNKIGELNG